MLFLAVQTQWRTAGMAGIRTGLDYQGVDAAIRMMGLQGDSAELFDGIRTMEYEALSVFAEEAQKRSKQQRNASRR